MKTSGTFKSFTDLRDETFKSLPNGKFTPGWGPIFANNIRKYLLGLLPNANKIDAVQAEIKNMKSVYAAQYDALLKKVQKAVTSKAMNKKQAAPVENTNQFVISLNMYREMSATETANWKKQAIKRQGVVYNNQSLCVAAHVAITMETAMDLSGIKQKIIPTPGMKDMSEETEADLQHFIRFDKDARNVGVWDDGVHGGAEQDDDFFAGTWMSWFVAFQIVDITPFSPKAGPFRWDFQFVKDDGIKIPKIFNDHIEYKGETLGEMLASDQLCDYLKTNYRPYSCFLTAIINTYPNQDLRKNGSRSPKPMNYENLLDFLSDGTMKVGDENPVSVEMAKKFFERYHLSFTAVNVSKEIVFEYEPETRTKKISPSHFYCLLHNQHIYVLNTETKGISNKKHVYHVSPNYSLVSRESYDTTIDSYEQLMNLKIEKETTVRVLFTGDLNNLLFYLIKECKYEPTCQVIDGNCKSISLKINDSWVVIKSPSSDNTEALVMEAGTEDVEAKQRCLQYIDERRKLKSTLINRNYLSHYDESFHMNLVNHKIGPIAGKLRDGNIKYAIDFSLAYSSILRELPFIPVCGHFDNFEAYDGADLVDHFLYNVRFYGKTVNELLYSETSERYTYGYNLKHYTGKYEVLSVCKISRSPRNTVKRVMDELWASSLDTQDKKNIMNMAIGCLGKLKSSHTETFLFNNADEAKAMMSAGDSVSVITNNVYVPVKDEFLNGAICMKNQPTEKMFYVNKSVETDTVNGFYPVQVLIWDTMRRKLFQLAQALKAQNVKVLAVKTDCLYVDRKVETIEGFTVIPKGERKFGCVTINKENVKMPTKLIEFTEVETCYDIKSPGAFKQVALKDEFDAKEWDAFLNAHKTVLVKGVLPGSGKTTNLVNYCKRNKLRVCIVAGINDLAKTHAHTFGIDAYTIDSFFGILFAKEYSKSTPVDAAQYDVIIFDEIFSYVSDRLKRVHHFIQQHSETNKKIFATGDCTQNEPIESINEDSDRFYNDIINPMFPVHIMLKRSRRLLTKEDEETTLAMQKFIFSKFDSMPRSEFVAKFTKKFGIAVKDTITYTPGTINQCYLNESCATLNKLYNKCESKGKDVVVGVYNWYEGMQVVNKTRFVLDLPHVNDKGRAVKKHTVFDTNSRYTILAFDGDDVVLESMFDEVATIPRNMLDKTFRPVHASTGHSIQGKTFTENIEIFDVTAPFVTAKWFWTAVTRCRQLKQLSINLHNTKKLDIGSYHMPNVIYNHNESDEHHDRLVVKPLTVEWVEQQVRNQHGRCYHCENVVNLIHVPGDHLNISIDRLDNSRGHCQHNCVVSCWKCNVTKK